MVRRRVTQRVMSEGEEENPEISETPQGGGAMSYVTVTVVSCVTRSVEVEVVEGE